MSLNAPNYFISWQTSLLLPYITDMLTRNIIVCMKTIMLALYNGELICMYHLLVHESNNLI